MFLHRLRARRTFVTSFTLVWIKITPPGIPSAALPVTSFTLVWIKITTLSDSGRADMVTSFTLVWIKMPVPGPLCFGGCSHELHARVD